MVIYGQNNYPRSFNGIMVNLYQYQKPVALGIRTAGLRPGATTSHVVLAWGYSTENGENNVMVDTGWGYPGIMNDSYINSLYHLEVGYR